MTKTDRGSRWDQSIPEELYDEIDGQPCLSNRRDELIHRAPMYRVREIALNRVHVVACDQQDMGILFSARPEIGPEPDIPDLGNPPFHREQAFLSGTEIGDGGRRSELEEYDVVDHNGEW